MRPSPERVFGRGRSIWAAGVTRPEACSCCTARSRSDLPFLVLLWSSLQRFYSAPSFAAVKTLSLDNYRAVLDYPGIGQAVWNSIFLALAAATTVMLISAVIAWLVLRTKIPGRWVLDNLASLPMVMPGIVTGLAIMVTYLALGGGIYGTIWILLIAYLTRFLPYGMRFNIGVVAAAASGTGGIRRRFPARIG